MEWLRLRENLAKKVKIRIGKWLRPNSFDTVSFSPRWPLSSPLQEVRSFLSTEKYLIDLDERKVFAENQPLYYTGLITNLNREGTSGQFISTVSFAHATDLYYEEAFSRAVGEFVERYCFLIYQNRHLLKKSIKELRRVGVAFINPLEFITLPGANFNKSNKFLWKEVTNFCTEEKKLLPAQLIFWNYCLDHRSWSEPLLRERNTCGLASGYSKNVAIRNALFEVIQRDAFFIYWFNEISPSKLVIDSSVENERLKKLLSWCKQRLLIVDFVDITADIPVPSLLCILRDQASDRNLVSFGIGSGFDIEKVLESALLEAVSLYRWSLEELIYNTETSHFSEIRQKKNWKNNFGVNERVFMWSRGDMWQHMSFLLSGKTRKLSSILEQTRSFKDIHAELRFVKKELSKLGSEYEPLVYFSDHPLAKKLSSNAVRVFVPALIPMYMEESGSVIDRHPRIKEVPEKIGFKSRDGVYPYPHPFP